MGQDWKVVITYDNEAGEVVSNRVPIGSTGGTVYIPDNGRD
jgi:hypothetical protein